MDETPITPDSLGSADDAGDTPSPGYKALTPEPAPGFDVVMDARLAGVRISAAASEAQAARRDAEVADRRAAQSAREARDAHEAAEKALSWAKRSAVVAAVSLVVAVGALASAWRPASSKNITCDSISTKMITVSRDGMLSGPYIMMTTMGTEARIALMTNRRDYDEGISLVAGGGEASRDSSLTIRGAAPNRFVEMGVVNTRDSRDLPRFFVVHDESRNVFTAANQPVWTGRD